MDPGFITIARKDQFQRFACNPMECSAWRSGLSEVFLVWHLDQSQNLHQTLYRMSEVNRFFLLHLWCCFPEPSESILKKCSWGSLDGQTGTSEDQRVYKDSGGVRETRPPSPTGRTARTSTCSCEVGGYSWIRHKRNDSNWLMEHLMVPWYQCECSRCLRLHQEIGSWLQIAL